MMKRLVRWAVRTLVSAAVSAIAAAVIARMAEKRRQQAGNGPLFPPIGGDTWPPVPEAPERPASK